MINNEEKPMIKSFEGLIVWQEAMDLVEMIYLEIKNFPKDETYELSSQMRRAGRLNYITQENNEKTKRQLDTVSRLLYALR